MEFYPIVNQTGILMANQKVAEVVQSVKLSDLTAISQETKQAIQIMQIPKIHQEQKE